MAKRVMKRAELGKVQEWLTDWRERCGGRGRPIPEELWEAAAEVAEVEGLSATARVLRLDQTRLARRMSPSEVERQQRLVPSRPQFVELQPQQQTPAIDEVVVRLTGRDGEGVEVSMRGRDFDIRAVMREFWNRAR